MIIEVNPDTLQTVAASIATAYDSIEEAAKILTSITTHNDWNCKERDTINDYTIENAGVIRKINEKSLNFSKIMKTISENFRQDESNISSLFSSVEAAIGAVVRITPINPVRGNISSIIGIIKDVGDKGKITPPVPGGGISGGGSGGGGGGSRGDSSRRQWQKVSDVISDISKSTMIMTMDSLDL